MRKRQTDYEYRETFKDYVYCYLKLVLGLGKNYYFITYQPEKLSCLLPHLINQQTKALFGRLAYVAVFEQTNKRKKKNILANYFDNWHSHLIITEEDYLKNKELFDDLKIRARSVYDLDGLINYLAKQASENRVLPTKNYGEPVLEPIKEKKGIRFIKLTLKSMDYTIDLLDKLLGIISPSFYMGQTFYRIFPPPKLL